MPPVIESLVLDARFYNSTEIRMPAGKHSNRPRKILASYYLMKLFTIKSKPFSSFVIISIIGLIGACSTASDSYLISIDADGLAVNGYDVVAFLTDDKATQGSKTFEFVWHGAKWLFSSEENLNKFKKEPELYAPEFGGYCAHAMADGQKIAGDPINWKVIDGKLFLMQNPEMKKQWEMNQAENIKKAQEQWAKLNARQ